MVQAVVFDFDLTLADSTPGIVECVNYPLPKMGMPPVDPGDIHPTIGLSLPRIFATLTGRSDPAGVARFSAGFIERAEQVMADSTVIFPHIPRILSRLKSYGLGTAIVSTKFRRRIEGILARDKLTDSFDVIIGGEDVDEHKPDPEGLYKALSPVEREGRGFCLCGGPSSRCRGCPACSGSLYRCLERKLGGQRFPLK